MGNLAFRDLKADEIDCRVAQATAKGVSLLLYKDARCDMNILDETVGAFNWQREHYRDNANCSVSIWDDDKKQWIRKEDTGTESNTEAEKGLASDSFKRACFNWGIGRELYTAPFIWVNSDNCNLADNNGKFKCNDKFSVKDIKIENKKIVGLTIYNITKKCTAFTMNKAKTATAAQPKKAAETEKPADDLPYEVVTEKKTNRDKFREFTAGWDKSIKAKIIKECGLADDSPDEAWQPALMQAIAIKAGATI